MYVISIAYKLFAFTLSIVSRKVKQNFQNKFQVKIISVPLVFRMSYSIILNLAQNLLWFIFMANSFLVCATDFTVYWFHKRWFHFLVITKSHYKYFIPCYRGAVSIQHQRHLPVVRPTQTLAIMLNTIHFVCWIL